MKKIVNILTLTRLFATFFLPLMWNYLDPVIMIVLIALILLTDFFDGMLARKFHVQSLFGSVADCVADKLFGIVIVLIMARYYKIFYIPVILELIIATINLVAAFLGATTKSSFLGKTKMWLLGITTTLGVLIIFNQEITEHFTNGYILKYLTFFSEYRLMIVYGAVLVTAGAEIMVAVDYARHILKELKEKKTVVKYDFKSKDKLKYVLFDTDYYLKHKDTPLSKHLLK